VTSHVLGARATVRVTGTPPAREAVLMRRVQSRSHILTVVVVSSWLFVAGAWMDACGATQATTRSFLPPKGGAQRGMAEPSLRASVDAGGP
jgi:hypothetical protein